MKFQILSKEPKVTIAGSISVDEITLLVKRVSDNSLLLAHIDAHEIEKFSGFDEFENLSTFDVRMMEINQFQQMIDSEYYEIQYVPYVNPEMVKNGDTWENITNVGEYKKYSFIDVEGYQAVKY